MHLFSDNEMLCQDRQSRLPLQSGPIQRPSKSPLNPSCGLLEATEKVIESRPKKPQDPSRDCGFFVIMRGTKNKGKRGRNAKKREFDG